MSVAHRFLSQDERNRLASAQELVCDAKDARNQLMTELHEAGVTVRALGEALGLSKSRVHDIVSGKAVRGDD